jgi:hypothetical protein
VVIPLAASIAKANSRTVNGSRDRAPFQPALGVNSEGVEREQALVAQARHGGVQRRQRLSDKGKRRMSSRSAWPRSTPVRTGGSSPAGPQRAAWSP